LQEKPEISINYTKEPDLRAMKKWPTLQIMEKYVYFIAHFLTKLYPITLK